MNALFRIKLISPLVAPALAFTLVGAMGLPAVAAIVSTQLVACPTDSASTIELLSAKGQGYGIKVNALEPIQVFQGWGQSDLLKLSEATKLNLIRIQVSAASGLAGKSAYISANEALPSAQCAGRRAGGFLDRFAGPSDRSGGFAGGFAGGFISGVANGNGFNSDQTLEADDDESDLQAAPVIQATAPGRGAGGLSSPSCCGFPVSSRPTSFLSGIGKFGARRTGGRRHGGADLYGKDGQSVMAVAAGVVVRAPYYFRARTLAVDVRHTGGFIVRYGEISGRDFGIRTDSKLVKGQKIGEMKYVTGAPQTMLHFELYKGNVSGKLTEPGTRYRRRSDLINPEPYLIRWKKNK